MKKNSAELLFQINTKIKNEVKILLWDYRRGFDAPGGFEKIIVFSPAE
jgi:hypothetical protein